MISYSEILICEALRKCVFGDFSCPFIVVDGGFSSWSFWGECSTSCGGGLQVRKRSCTKPVPSAGGKNCSHLGDDVDQQLCNNFTCPGKGNAVVC